MHAGGYCVTTGVGRIISLDNVVTIARTSGISEGACHRDGIRWEDASSTAGFQRREGGIGPVMGGRGCDVYRTID